MFIILLQFTLVAKDLGNPVRSSPNSTVDINVVRNENGPTFRESEPASILQTHAVDRRITTVRAEDRDPVVIANYLFVVTFRGDIIVHYYVPIFM